MRIYYSFILLVICISIGSNDLIEPTPYLFPELDFFPPMPMSVHNPVTVEGVDLGRHLFYDPILSLDSTFSCANCHQQKNAFTDSPNRFSKGINGTLMSRNTMPLFNLAWYPTLFWDGKSNSLETQVFHPVSAFNEMNLKWPLAVERIKKNKFYQQKFKLAFGEETIDSVLIAKSIAQFERTLISHNSKYDNVLRGEAFFTEEEFKGFELMNDQAKGDCLHCHTTDADALTTTTGFSNNGLDAIFNANNYVDKGRGTITKNINEYGLFKIPSLRQISLTAPYMHDGRFKTLEEVLDFYSNGVHNSFNIDSKMGAAKQGGVQLNTTEKQNIIAFLKTLTDSVFIQKEAFSNPFN